MKWVIVLSALCCFCGTPSKALPTTQEAAVNALQLGFFSIPVLDMGAAKAFYGPVMGWTFNDRDPKFSYIFAGQAMIGSLEVASDKIKPGAMGPLIFFQADSMQKTLARVKENGGTVLEEQAMDGGARGYTSRIQDPFGNVMGFWAPEN